MHKTAIAAILAVTTTMPAIAGDATAVGVGTGIAKSQSESKAVAISGQGGSGVGSVTIAANPANTIATVNNTGTSTIKNVPSVFAPGLAAAGLETCLGSVSGGGSFVGTGFSFGSTIPDPGCAARLDARTLWSMGLKKAAVARLCLQPEIARSMPEVCVHYLPAAYAAAPIGYEPAVAVAVPGQIWLVEGSTGQDRLCTNYDSARQRCRVWAGQPHAKRHVAVINHSAAPSAAVPAEQKDDTK
jgi:hypothetical protein